MHDQKSGGRIAAALLGAAAVLALLLSRLSVSGVVRLLLKLALIVLIALAVLVGVMLFFALHKSKDASAPKAPELSKENEALLTQGRANLAQLRSMAARIRNSEIRGKCAPICASIDKILKALREQPEDIPRVRSFFNYYLPTLGTILTKYEYLERSHAPLDEMTVKVSGCLDQIAAAMEKQYANLFEDDILDMTAEMQTLTAVCRKDGLLTDGAQTDSGIHLTL